MSSWGKTYSCCMARFMVLVKFLFFCLKKKSNSEQMHTDTDNKSKIYVTATGLLWFTKSRKEVNDRMQCSPPLFTPLAQSDRRDTIRDKISGSPHQIVPERHNAEVKVSKTELLYYAVFFP